MLRHRLPPPPCIWCFILRISLAIYNCRSNNINPRTNVVYLTAYSGYSLEAWDTGASGFMLKPITPEGVQAQLRNLRYPFHGGVGR